MLPSSLKYHKYSDISSIQVTSKFVTLQVIIQNLPVLALQYDYSRPLEFCAERFINTKLITMLRHLKSHAYQTIQLLFMLSIEYSNFAYSLSEFNQEILNGLHSPQ